MFYFLLLERHIYMNLYENTCIHICAADWDVGKENQKEKLNIN